MVSPISSGFPYITLATLNNDFEDNGVVALNYEC